MTTPETTMVQAMATGFVSVLDDDEVLAMLAAVKPDLAARLFAAAAFAISEVDQFRAFVADGGAPTVWGVYPQTCVACVGDILDAADRKGDTK